MNLSKSYQIEIDTIFSCVIDIFLANELHINTKIGKQIKITEKRLRSYYILLSQD